MRLPRRDSLKLLALGGASGSVLSMRSSLAAPQASVAGPTAFPEAEYKLLRELCDRIIPADEGGPGAVYAGAPELIDLLSSENPEYRRRFMGGLRWLNGLCADRYGAAYLECTRDQQTEALDLIAYRENAENEPELETGVAFFAELRALTLDGFFTSKAGFDYLEYVGNTAVSDFPGCPEPGDEA